MQPQRGSPFDHRAPIDSTIKIKVHSSCEIEDFVETHLCKLVCDTPIAPRNVLIKDIGRRLPLQLQCSYQGQQDDVGQSVRGNYKTRF